MDTLLLRFAAPLQSWGASSRFNIRMTRREPTKSGTIGFIAAALGIRREDSGALAELARLRFGVRADQPGQLLHDFHTAHTMDGKQSFVSHRHYLADAVFLVGLASEDAALLANIESAVKNPEFPLYLGRRSCPPSGEVCLGIRAGIDLFDALTAEPWHASTWFQKRYKTADLEIIMDAGIDEPGAYQVRDIPISFDQIYRKYVFRHVKNVVNAVSVRSQLPENSRYATTHDAINSLEG
jgi:CRISPR system Cascade subunit CasD